MINRRFLFNVINTVKPGYFQQEISKALKDRKEKQALTQNKFIQMNDDMLRLITSSNHVSTGKCPHADQRCSDPRQGSESAAEDLEEEDARAVRCRARANHSGSRRHSSYVVDPELEPETRLVHADADEGPAEGGVEAPENNGPAPVHAAELTGERCDINF